MNSKATLRIHAKDFFHMIPKIIHPQIEKSRYYAANSQSLVIQGDSSRNRNDNVEECYKKLHDFIIAAGRATVRGETSQAQREKVKGLYEPQQFYDCLIILCLLHCHAANAKRTRCGCELRRCRGIKRLHAKDYRRDQVTEPVQGITYLCLERNARICPAMFVTPMLLLALQACGFLQLEASI